MPHIIQGPRPHMMVLDPPGLDLGSRGIWRGSGEKAQPLLKVMAHLCLVIAGHITPMM